MALSESFFGTLSALVVKRWLCSSGYKADLEVADASERKGVVPATDIKS